jgi:hypothetical protein
MLAQHPVIRAKIVAPLGNAVRLVHRDQHRLAFGQHFGKTRHAQPFRRDEQIIQPTVQIIDADLARSRPVAAGVNALGAQAEFAQLGDLILHQRDQG